MKTKEILIKGAKLHNLKNITVGIPRNKLVVITGLSGSGKTTLIRLLNGLIPQVYEGKLTGKIKILGKSTVEYKAGELAKYIGNVRNDWKIDFLN